MTSREPNSWIGTVAAAALNRFDGVMDWLGLAGGKAQGREYLPINPRRDDHQPGSFAINRDTGAWLDGASGDKGGDLVALVAFVHGERQIEAADSLGAFLGLQVPERKARPAGDSPKAGNANASPASKKSHSDPESRPVAPSQSAGEIVMPIPEAAPLVPKAHPKLGATARQWEYRDAAGRLLFLVCRFEKPDGSKDIRPLSLRRMPDGALVWRWLGADAPRSLYGSDHLAARPDASVMIGEGEKAADAAAVLFPDYVAITSPNGAKAADKADWSALTGRRCVLWPDADAAGDGYAAEVSKRLHAAGAAEVRRLNLSHFLVLPDGTSREQLPEGWDAADALAEGYTAAMVAEIAARADAFMPVAPEKVGAGDTAAGSNGSPTAANRSRCFDLDESGVWHVATDKDGNSSRHRVCTPVDVLAMVRDPHNKGWGKLLLFRDPDGRDHREIVPDTLLCGDAAELERLLRGRGLQIAPKGRALLLEYLITSRPKQRARTTSRTGWHQGAAARVFVLPERSFGDAGEVWIFEDGTAGADYQERGTLEEWRREVAALCIGNSRLAFAVSLAFAAPLVDIVGGESGGFHYSGESGDGKTTALRVAASVCGGADYMRQWRTSDNGMEYLALQHCDAPLLMDELAQINAKILGDAIYMMGNSSGKSRARAQGGLRETMKWRILFLSSGEVGVASHVASVGMSTTAGMEGRMAEIPARVCDDPPGIYETLHGEPTPKAMSQRLAHAVKKYHGTAFAEFLTELVRRDPDEVRETLLKARKLFAARYLSDGAGNQVLRVADRCALVGAAGEMATSWGITGWPPGEAIAQAGVCFQAWLDHRGGEGNQEEKAMLVQVRGFLERHGEARFSDWRRSVAKDTHATRVQQRAGWRRLCDKESGRQIEPPDDGGYLSDDTVTEYLILPNVFKEEVCKGFNHRAVAKLMANRGYLRTEKDGRFDPKVKPPGEAPQRMFHVLPSIFDME